MSTERVRECRQCHTVYIGEQDISIAFRCIHKNRGASVGSLQNELSHVCRHCQNDNRIEARKKDRWKHKAIDTRRRHARHFGLSVDDMIHKHGWYTDVIADEMEKNYKNGCPECHDSYSNMANGYRDLTVDIWDPRIEPGYGSNTRLMCNTCNQEKGDMIPEVWTIFKRLRRQRDEQLKKNGRITQLGLFQL